VIAHRLSTVVHADEIVVLEAAASPSAAPTPSCSRKNGLYAEMWARQARTRSILRSPRR
jgi:ABC-type transport system involved in Fe-S cluster assembly fused permease/ATPase subunit